MPLELVAEFTPSTFSRTALYGSVANASPVSINSDVMVNGRMTSLTSYSSAASYIATMDGQIVFVLPDSVASTSIQLGGGTVSDALRVFALVMGHPAISTSNPATVVTFDGSTPPDLYAMGMFCVNAAGTVTLGHVSSRVALLTEIFGADHPPDIIYDMEAR